MPICVCVGSPQMNSACLIGVRFAQLIKKNRQRLVPASVQAPKQVFRKIRQRRPALRHDAGDCRLVLLARAAVLGPRDSRHDAGHGL